tara:strand:+ start:684 stop:2039 length:1356 start_codon:yes stop_codon:yes gene_type:complete
MKLKKPIVSEGVYLVSTDTGERKTEIITTEHLTNWAKTHAAMKQKGLSLPAPLAHSSDSIPIKIKEGSDGTLPRSDINAGWWEDLWVKKGKDGANELWGEVNIPDHSIAKKVEDGTIKETSIYSRPEYKDGDGNVWKDSLMHVALVTHPIENGQKPFSPSDGLVLSMSHRTHTLMADGDMTPTAGEGSINDLIKNLLDIGEIAIPKSTTMENLVEALNAALIQKRVSDKTDEEEGSVNQPGVGAVEQPAPIAMSLTAKQVAAIQMANVNNPDTGQPFTKDELEVAVSVTTPASPERDTMMSQISAYQQSNAALVGYLGTQQKTDLANRASTLMSQGKLTKAYYEQSIQPQIESFQMSFSPEGQPVSQTIEQVMSALESQPTPQGLGTIEGGLPHNVAQALTMSQGPVSELTQQPNPLSADEPLDDQNAQNIADQFLRNVGQIPLTVPTGTS